VRDARQDAFGLQHDRAVHHAAIELGRARRGGIGRQHARRPFDGRNGGLQCAMDRVDLLGMDAQLGAKAELPRRCQIG